MCFSLCRMSYQGQLKNTIASKINIEQTIYINSLWSYSMHAVNYMAIRYIIISILFLSWLKAVESVATASCSHSKPDSETPFRHAHELTNNLASANSTRLDG